MEITRRWAFVASGLVISLMVSCGKARLTNDQVGQALLTWQLNTGVFMCVCGGPCTSTLGPPVTVVGIQDLPQQNAARAELTFNKAVFHQGCPNQKNYTGPGEAMFIHYTDGRWILEKISTSEGFNSLSWEKLNIEVK